MFSKARFHKELYALKPNFDGAASQRIRSYQDIKGATNFERNLYAPGYNLRGK